jgi:hypothetical protein
VTVGDRAPAVSGTPRSRFGAVVSAASPRTPRTPTDVVLRMPGSGATVDALAASLPALIGAEAAMHAAKASPSKASHPKANEKKGKPA